MKRVVSFLMALTLAVTSFTGMSNVSFAAERAKVPVVERPDDGVTEDQPFAPGTGGSANFRIPCLVSLDDGTIVAGCDARWTWAADAGGIDTIVSYSKDNGATWHYTFANHLGDNGNVANRRSTALIDPAMATDGETIYLVADLYPAGYAINSAAYLAAPGQNGLDAQGRLRLATAEGVDADDDGVINREERIASTTNYDAFYLEKISADVADDAEEYYVIKDAQGTVVEGYAVDAHFNITGNGVDTNLFFEDTPYLTFPTDYLYMVKSTDGGATWSIPTLINAKVPAEQSLLVGPGNGIVVTKPDGGKRIIFTVYDYTSADGHSAVIYSDDGGVTWTRGQSVVDQTSEATVAEVNGKLYMFTRHHNGYYVSDDYGATWSSKINTGITYASSTQLSVIAYSKEIDGKPALLLSAPSDIAGRRTGGRIFVGLVDETNGNIEWKYVYDVNGSAAYAYSCIAELKDGSIGLLYEYQGSAITYENIRIEDIAKGSDVNLWLYDSENNIVETMDMSSGETVTLRVKKVTEDSTIEVSSSNNELLSVQEENGTITITSGTVTGLVQEEVTVTDGTNTIVLPVNVVDAENYKIVTLSKGEEAAITDSTGDYSSANVSGLGEIATATITGVAGQQTAAVQLGTDVNFNGAQEALEKSLLTIAVKDPAAQEKRYTISGTTAEGDTVYLDHATGRNNTPFTANEAEIRIDAKENSASNSKFKFYNAASGKYLHFHSQDGGLYYDVCSSDGCGAKHEYELYKAGEDANSEIKGYTKVTGTTVADGEYLIAGISEAGDYYLLRPSKASNKFTYLGKLLKAAEASTSITFVGQKEGQAQVVIGDVTYYVVVKYQTKEVNLNMGGKKSLVGASIEIETGDDVVNVTESSELHPYAPVTTLADGEYVLGNNVAIVTNRDSGYTNTIGLAMEAADWTKGDYSQNLWTLTQTTNGYYLQDANDQYFSFNGSNVSMSETPQVLVIADYPAYGGYTISYGGQHLNNFSGTNDRAAGYGAKDGNSSWKFYRLSSGYVVTAAQAGEATVVVDGIRYHITVKDALQEADYSKVDAALKKIPKDLSEYTQESREILEAAIAAVVRGKDYTQQDVVDGYAKDLEAALAGLLSIHADYSKVDAALERVPEDLSGYTLESVAKLEAAIAAVVRGKDYTEQDVVDGYAKALETAIAKLVIDQKITLKIGGKKSFAGTAIKVDVGQKVINVAKSSQVNPYVPVTNLTEGNYVIGNNSHIVTNRDSGQTDTIGLGMVKADWNTGDYSKYMWTLAKTEDGYTLQDAKGKYLNFNGKNVSVNKNAQELTVEEFAAQNGYTIGKGGQNLNNYSGANNKAAGYGGRDGNSSWKFYQLSSGYVVTGTAAGETIIFVDGARYRIIVEDAIQEADYSKVDDALAEVPSDLSAYTQDSKAAVEAAVAAVVRGKDYTEQDVVDGYAKALETAITGLLTTESVQALQTKVTEAESAGYQKDQYLVKRWNDYEKALTNAKECLQNLNDLIQEDIDETLEKLTNAIEGLAVRPVYQVQESYDLADVTAPTGTTQNQPFAAGTAGSNLFRIPASITLSDGTILASADARWNHGSDAWTDIIVSRSKDDGATWEYSFAAYNPDSVNERRDYSSTIIDSVLVSDHNGKIYMVADIFPGGAANAYAPYGPEASTGYVYINGVERLVLYLDPQPAKQDDDNYVYYVGDFGEDGLAPIYEVWGDDTYSEEASFYMDTRYYLYTAEKEKMYCSQLGNETKMVQQNVFFHNALLHVRCAMYLYMTSSTDGGKTWADPVILNPQIRREKNTDPFYGVGPGPGLCLEDGTIMIPAYTYNGGAQLSSFIYSTDEGKTWKRSEDASTHDNWSSESCLVQIDPVTVRQFFRSGNPYVQYTDHTFVNGEWKAGEVVSLTEVPKRAGNGCQIVAIPYSKTINGKPVILYATPANTGARADGKIYIFTVDMETEGKPLTLVGTYDVVPGTTDDYYAYSSMSELKDGSVGLLYESQGAEITFRKVTVEELAPEITFDDAQTSVTAKVRAALQSLYVSYKDKEEKDYIAESWSAFDTALKAAKDVLDNANATKEELDAAKAALVEAISGLMENPPAIWGDILEADREGLTDVPEGIWTAGIKDLTYNGTKQTQEFRVYDGNKMLTLGKDYTVSIKNNQNAYTDLTSNKAPQVVLKMKGDYKGTKNIAFKILPVELANVAVDDIHVTYNGKKQTPAPVLTWNGKKLTVKDFYVEEYKQGSNDFKGSESQTTEIDLTLKGQGNFTGEKKIKLTIGIKGKQFAMDKMKVVKVAKKADWNYKDATSQEGITLDGFKVMNGKTELKEGTDYTVSYENNKVVGTATMIITGTARKGAAVSYHGEKRVTFTINGTPASKFEVNGLPKTGYPYTGDAIEPLTLKDVNVSVKGGSILDKEIDAYTVSYEKNVDKGTAVMYLTGNPEMGYTGTKKVTFKIAAANLDTGDYKVTLVGNGVNEDGTVAYTAGGATPQVVVTDKNDNELAAGVDYTVSYKNNKAVAGAKAPTVVIKGKGNYAKSTEKKFEIVLKEVGENNNILTVSAKDKSLTNKAGSWKQTFKVYDVNGKALSANKDYDKTAVYYRVTKGKDEINLNDNPATTIEVGDVIKIVVTLQGNNYRGTASGTYRIIDKDKDISKAVFKIKAQEYTGKEIRLTANDMDKAELKKVTLTLGTHYEAVKYEKNINKGTAKVTFRGKGDFGGEKTVTFKINQRDASKNWWSGIVEAWFN